MLTPDEARVLITTSISDGDLEEVIAREEAWLARRIGPLEGEREETFDTSYGDVLRLTRKTTQAQVAVQDESGEVTDWSLRGWSDVVLGSSTSWVGTAQVAYTPDDEDEVRRSLITLLRLTLGESAFASEAAGGYSVAVDLQAQRVARHAAWRTLLRPAQPSSVRLLSTVPTTPRAIGPVSVEPLLGS